MGANTEIPIKTFGDKLETDCQGFAAVWVFLICLDGITDAQTMKYEGVCSDVLHLDFRDHALDLATSKSSVAWKAWACTASDSETKSAMRCRPTPSTQRLTC